MDFVLWNRQAPKLMNKNPSCKLYFHQTPQITYPILVLAVKIGIYLHTVTLQAGRLALITEGSMVGGTRS
jgi:hypothetical protein